MNKHGQAIIEYVIIATLVIIGIVLMGPYVLRSVNAHYKLWDDGVQDSFTENITQAPNGDLPIIPANCSCPISQGSCGSPASCGLGYRQFQYNCNIPGCNGALEDSFCGTTIDPSCCTGWVGIGCGSFTCPAGGCPTTPTLPSPDGKNCYYGYQIQVPPCGTSKAIQCVYNAQPAPYPCGSQTTSPGLCTLPGCLGVLSCPSVQACPNSPGTPGAPSLLTNDGIKFVPAPGDCTGASCQYTCANGYIFQNGMCVRTFEVAPWSNCGSCTAITNGCDCSFSMCTTSTITGVSITDISSPMTSPFCNNPGNPGEECSVTLSFK